jgi:hypothetical protein
MCKQQILAGQNASVFMSPNFVNVAMFYCTKTITESLTEVSH